MKILNIVSCIFLLMTFLSPKAYGRSKVIVNQGFDYQKAFAEKKTKYIIKQDIDLGGKTIKIGAGSSLVFRGGSFTNGTIIGDKTAITSTKNNVFHSCSLSGTWNADCAYSSMFDDDLDAMILLQNMCHLSSVLKLYANRRYDIDADGKEIVVESVSAAGDEKPLLVFHTTNPNVVGIMLVGSNITLKNLRIVDDYDASKDAVYGQNDKTNGSTIGVKALDRVVNSLAVEGCEFSGGTSSSFVASSQVKECCVGNCYFSGYMADHAVYCSTQIESFKVFDCIIRDVINTTGLFKVRGARRLNVLSLKNIVAHNLNGYMAVASLLETPGAKLLFDRINVTKDSASQSIFCGFCVTDETRSLEGTGRFNANELVFRNCSFEYGYNGASLVYPGSGKRACINEVCFEDSVLNESNFGGINSNTLSVNNCSFNNCCGGNGIYILSRFASIRNSSFSNSKDSLVNYLFLVNYGSQITRSFVIDKVEMGIEVNDLFRIERCDNLNVVIQRTNLARLNRNVFSTRNNSVVNYKLSKLNIKKKGLHFKEAGTY